MSNNTGNILIALLAGAVVGAGIGILLAPDKGSVTRQKLKDGFDSSKENLLEKYNELAQLLKQKSENAGEGISELIDRAISSGSHEKDVLISLLESKLELLKGQTKKAAVK